MKKKLILIYHKTGFFRKCYHWNVASHYASHFLSFEEKLIQICTLAFPAINNAPLEATWKIVVYISGRFFQTSY